MRGKNNLISCEQFLDEVATPLTELYDLSDEAAIKLVVDFQAADFFSIHDEKEEMRTVERAKLDAHTLDRANQNRNETRCKQQRRVQAKNPR